MKTLFLASALLLIAASATAIDLDVGWIERLPRMDFVESPQDPTREGWPSVGQVVTWRAHVVNWDGEALQNVSYEWRLDGVVAARGTFAVPENGSATVDFPWRWEFARHQLEFVVDPSNAVNESEEANNALTVDTDALSVGFYVEQGVYDFFHRYQHTLTSAGSNSFEDFAQRQIGFINGMFAKAITLETPDGVLDRWRLDEIVVVPDGALPLSGPHDVTSDVAQGVPNNDDRSVDVIYGFPSSLRELAYGNDTARTRYFDMDTVVRHELGHVRYLTDNYAFIIQHDGVTRFVNIKENGRPVVGTPLMPLGGTKLVYWTIEDGLMKDEPQYLDRYSAGALNQIAGYRARGVKGNSMAGEFPTFMENIPARNRIRFVDPSGTPLGGADIRLYRPEAPKVPQVPVIQFNDQPDIETTADSNGEVVFDGDPFRRPGGWIGYDRNGQPFLMFLTGVSIIRVQKGTDVHFVYFELTAANRAFWRGMKDEARYEFVVGANPCATAPVLLAPKDGSLLTAGNVPLSWTRTPGAAGYLVFAAVNGGPEHVVGVSTDTQASVAMNEPGNVVWRVQAQVDQCLKSNSATATFSLYAPGPRRRGARE